MQKLNVIIKGSAEDLNIISNDIVQDTLDSEYFNIINGKYTVEFIKEQFYELAYLNNSRFDILTYKEASMLFADNADIVKVNYIFPGEGDYGD